MLVAWVFHIEMNSTPLVDSLATAGRQEESKHRFDLNGYQSKFSSYFHEEMKHVKDLLTSIPESWPDLFTEEGIRGVESTWTNTEGQVFSILFHVSHSTAGVSHFAVMLGY